MKNVLADLALESEAATALAIRLARAFDRPQDDARAPDGAPAHAGRQVLDLQARQPLRAGGDGVPGRQRLRGGGRRRRDGARLPRDAAQLDLGRRGQHHGARPAARPAQGRCGRGAGARARAGARRRMPRSTGWPMRCPRASRRWPPRPRRAAWRRTWRSRCRARCCAQTAPPAVVGAFCASRLGGDWGHAFGTLGAGTDFDPVIARARAALNADHPSRTPMADLILHHYATSPFSEKLRLILGYKKLAWKSVIIPQIMPKPDVVGAHRRLPQDAGAADRRRHLLRHRADLRRARAHARRCRRSIPSRARAWRASSPSGPTPRCSGPRWPTASAARARPTSSARRRPKLAKAFGEDRKAMSVEHGAAAPGRCRGGLQVLPAAHCPTCSTTPTTWSAP